MRRTTLVVLSLVALRGARKLGLCLNCSCSNVNVNVISRTALIRNRVSRRVFHVSNITWGVLYLFQEAQTH